MRTAISNVEKQVLWRKYRSIGYDSDTANKKIKEFCDFIKSLALRLKKQNKSEEDINKRFKREFEKLCRRVETERLDKENE